MSTFHLPCAVRLHGRPAKFLKYDLMKQPRSRRCFKASAICNISPTTTAGPTATPPPQAPIPKRAPKRKLVEDRPFSDFLTDTFHRQHDYLRISVSERCNLRCLYCMPEEGVPLSPPAHLLTSAEITHLSSLFVSEGVTKIRLTGGEPTVRQDILPLIQSIGALRPQGLQELCLTTNGISLHRKLDSMVEAGVTGINLSLDTLDPFQFQIMTRRNGFDAVMKSIDRIIELNRVGANIKLKINCVVMRGLNEKEIIPFVDFGRDRDVEVRFIEYMPFDGNKWSHNKMVSYQEMLGIIQNTYPNLQKVQDHKNDTSKTFQVPGFRGKLGFITSMTHNFCGSCNRLRITSDGSLKVCLFGNTEVSLRDILRKQNHGEPLDKEDFARLDRGACDQKSTRAVRGDNTKISPEDSELLSVIGLAVKRKKKQHAGMGKLENMKNRPMILIDQRSTHLLSTQKLPQSARVIFSSSVPGDLNRIRAYSIQSQPSTVQRGVANKNLGPDKTPAELTHLTSAGQVHMVDIGAKVSTCRVAIAIGKVVFSNREPLSLIRAAALKKGDVLAISRIAGIMAAKRTSDLVPLCHLIGLTAAEVDLELFDAELLGQKNSNETFGEVHVRARVECEGKTGVEMEALTAVMGACLTIVDMCKAVDRGMKINDVQVVLKKGGRSGTWRKDGEGDHGHMHDQVNSVP